MRRVLLSVLLVCGLTGPLSAAEVALTPEQQRIQELERQVRELQAELERLRQSRTVTVPLPAPARRNLPPGVPPNAVEQEFNGAKYYLIPLNGRKRSGPRSPEA